MGEVIKYGCIKDESSLKILKSKMHLSVIEDIIEICVSIKRDKLNRDEKRQGEEKPKLRSHLDTWLKNL